MKSGKRILVAVLAFDLLAFLGFFAFALASYAPDRVIPTLALRWEIAEALLALFRWLPALQFLAVAAALGSAYGDSGELLVSAILPGVLLAILVATAGLIAGPGLEESRSAALATSDRFNEAIEASRKALDGGLAAEARAAFNRAEAIDAKDPRIDELRDRVVGAELRAGREAAAAAGPRDEGKTTAPAESATSGREFYLKALSYFERKDYFSAHYYAALAARVDPSLTEAPRLAARSWEALSTASGGSTGAQKNDFFMRKLEAYSLLRAGDFIGAFREFTILARENSLDRDVRRYLEESRVELEKAAFFKDEADRALAARAYDGFFAVLPNAAPGGAPDGLLRILAAKEAAFTQGAAYFFEVEYLEAAASAGKTEKLTHVSSAYAKLTEGRLLLVSVERDKPASVYRPKAAGAGPKDRAPSAWLTLALDPETAFRLAAARDAPATLSALGAYESARVVEAFGLDQTPLYRELARRLGLPFALLTASTLGALIGVRFRFRGDGSLKAFSWLGLLLLAAPTAALAFLIEGIDGAISAYLVSLFPGPASLGVSLGVRTAFLLASVLLAAGLRGDDGAGGRGNDDAA